MSDPEQNDAVDYFSQIAPEFQMHYENQAAYQERLHIWGNLIDTYAANAARALDMGCGTGIFTFYLGSKGITQVIGIDAAERMIKLCERQKSERSLDNVQFIRAELPSLPGVELETADLIISSSLLEYIEDFGGMLALFSRLLHDQGILIVSLPNASCLNRKYQRLKFRLRGEPKVYRYIKNMSTPRKLASRLQPYGFKMLEVHYYDHARRLSRLLRMLKFPPQYSEDLFVAVFLKGPIRETK